MGVAFHDAAFATTCCAFYEDLNMIAMIGMSDWPCWLAEACKILLLLLLHLHMAISGSHVEQSQRAQTMPDSCHPLLSFWQVRCGSWAQELGACWVTWSCCAQAWPPGKKPFCQSLTHPTVEAVFCSRFEVIIHIVWSTPACDCCNQFCGIFTHATASSWPAPV